MQRCCTGLFSRPEKNSLPILKILTVSKSALEKKAGEKKKPGGKNEQKIFFSGISLKPWGNDRL